MKIRFRQILASSDHLYGLDERGEVWFRSLIPRPIISSISQERKEEETKKRAAEAIWRRLNMKCMPPKELLRINKEEQIKQEPVEAPKSKEEIEVETGVVEIEVDNADDSGPWIVEGSEVD